MFLVRRWAAVWWVIGGQTGLGLGDRGLSSVASKYVNAYFRFSFIGGG
jgi:hypothetical protein